MEVPSNFNVCLGEVIRISRKDAGLTQYDLAEKAGLTRRFIQELENGRSDVSLQTLYKLSVAMDTSLNAVISLFEARIAVMGIASRDD